MVLAQVEKTQQSYASEQALTEKLRQEINEVQNDSHRKVRRLWFRLSLYWDLS